MSKASEAKMAELHERLAAILLEGMDAKDENGKPNTAILNVARQFLKDNFITADAGNKATPLGQLAGLPEFDPEDGTVVPIRSRG